MARDDAEVMPADVAQPACSHREVLQLLAEHLTKMLSQTAAGRTDAVGQQRARKKARMAEAAVKLQALSAPLPTQHSQSNPSGMG